MYSSKRAARCLPRPAHHLLSFKLLRFSDTEEVKYRNARLSHLIRYSYIKFIIILSSLD